MLVVIFVFVSFSSLYCFFFFLFCFSFGWFEEVAIVLVRGIDDDRVLEKGC